MGALFGLVTSLVIFGIRCSAGVNQKSSSVPAYPSEGSLICPEYGFLYSSILFCSTAVVSRQQVENTNLNHEKIWGVGTT